MTTRLKITDAALEVMTDVRTYEGLDDGAIERYGRAWHELPLPQAAPALFHHLMEEVRRNNDITLEADGKAPVSFNGGTEEARTAAFAAAGQRLAEEIMANGRISIVIEDTVSGQKAPVAGFAVESESRKAADSLLAEITESFNRD